MLKIAVVDDDREVTENIKSYCLDFGNDKKISVIVDCYSDGADFLEEYRRRYDIIFMDIEMRKMNGMETARKLRETDRDSILIFITQMTQYALDAFRVDALDYLVKPVDFYSFELVMRKALKHLEHHTVKKLIINMPGEKKILRSSEIYYVEVLDHYLTYHTKQGNIRVRGNLSEIEEEYCACGFLKCNRYCLVNIRYISAIRKSSILVHGDELDLPRQKRQEVLLRIVRYRGGAV